MVEPERLGPDWARVREQFDELRSVLPSLAELPDPTPESAAEVLLAVAETTERLRRRVIRDRILRASLQELMGALLQSRDAESRFHTLIAYLRQILGVDELLLVRRVGREPSRWRGHHLGRSDRPETIELPTWCEDIGGCVPSEVLPETSPGSSPGDVTRPVSDPLRYGLVIALESDAVAARQTPLGYLCCNGSIESDEDWSPQEIGRRVAGMLETLSHRDEMERADRFRRQLLEAMRDGLLAVDGEGRIVEANAGAARLLGTATTLRGDTVASLPPSLGAHLEHILSEKQAAPPREVVFRSNGQRRSLSVATSALQDDGGRFRGLVVNIADLTSIREMEEEIDRLDRLAALGRFAAGVAHEIRNPLAGIGAGVEYLAAKFGADAPEQEDVRFVLGEVSRLNLIVTDLLDYTQPRPLELQPIKAAHLAHRVRLGLAPLAREREVRIEVAGPEDVLVEVDADRIEQVLLNLVRNAIEASPAGQSVTLAWERGSVRRPFSFIVEDRGTGLSDDAIRRAFEPFFTTKGNGTGLGLYLSHAIVEQHGGKLVLGNQPAGGASIRVELPTSETERIHENAVVHIDH